MRPAEVQRAYLQRAKIIRASGSTARKRAQNETLRNSHTRTSWAGARIASAPGSLGSGRAPPRRKEGARREKRRPDAATPPPPHPHRNPGPPQQFEKVPEEAKRRGRACSRRGDAEDASRKELRPPRCPHRRGRVLGRPPPSRVTRAGTAGGRRAPLPQRSLPKSRRSLAGGSGGRAELQTRFLGLKYRDVRRPGGREFPAPHPLPRTAVFGVQRNCLRERVILPSIRDSSAQRSTRPTET
ncbi:serine/arginine repetitive matrix protein 1-like [Herpailurus yagouaroundi]|uniref:serine/arginine repetitive matrix protein 1-like n=1 Tax=Herpailurus yagouaroundi TaxID=1608482 RepID=UPI001AD71011|nr:serine/arginine repetitive matrix protein 1-like [Puma yagouaroundi]